MKITLLSTYSGGGAGIACRRLHHALEKEGMNARLLVQQKLQETGSMRSLFTGPLDLFYSKIRLAKEVFRFAVHERSREDRFQFSVAQEGVDLSDHPWIKDADIIHLHWINQGFLSIDSIEKLVRTGKPVVWTLHDMWAFTGGCHYSGQCLSYETRCHHCPFLKDPSEHDLSTRVWKRKSELLNSSQITFVTCSDWLKALAGNSGLLKTQRIESIPNPIDTAVFKPEDKKESRKRWNLPDDKKLILFGAMNVQDKRKGFAYLTKALAILSEKYPETKKEVELVIFGKTKTELGPLFFPGHHLNTLTSAGDIVKAYSSSNVFVLPSLEDNLPNTVMESLACGTPVVAFRNGGTPEMVDHLQNGYLAKYKDAEDMADGIYRVLYNTDSFAFSCRKKVLDHYDQGLVAQRYISLYKDLLKAP